MDHPSNPTQYRDNMESFKLVMQEAYQVLSEMPLNHGAELVTYELHILVMHVESACGWWPEPWDVSGSDTEDQSVGAGWMQDYKLS